MKEEEGEVVGLRFGKWSAGAHFWWGEEEFLLSLEFDSEGNIREKDVYLGDMPGGQPTEVDEWWRNYYGLGPEFDKFVERLKEILCRKWKELKKELKW